MNFWQKFKLKSLRSKVQKLHDQGQQNSKMNPQAEIKAQHELAQFYDKRRYDKGLPHAQIYALECYRAAAALGDAKAQYICGQRLLEQAKFWDAWARGSIYGATIHQKYAKDSYEEAFSYLNNAEDQSYALAKRLLGMANIHGWGVPKNLDQGYKLVLESIELEKAWGRATKIFEELKLNSPEFFGALRNYKGQ